MRPAEFAKRRRQLMRMIGHGGIAILPAAPVRLRNGDVEYRYRQDSDFHYLTAFDEPDSVAVLVPGRDKGEYLLFCRERDPQRELWDGSRAGTEGAVSEHGADDAFPIGDIDDILPGLLEGRDRVYYTMGIYPDFDQRVIGWINGLRAQVRSGSHPPQEFVSLDHLLHDMRLYKSRGELAALRRAARIAVAAHRRAMQMCRPGLMEYQIEAELLHEFHSRRADISYEPIVGSGRNACVLHYRANSAELKDGDLLLVDAGCEYDYYASDVTRTYPVNGRFSAAQRAVYDVVLAAQQAAIGAVREGNHWNDPHEAALREVTRGLIDIGLLKGKPATLMRKGEYRRFFMHRTGHWLGMDVHDVGDYKVDDEWRVLECGMVMTIEPGIYIAPDAQAVDRRWRGIGVRIEDDVAVTRDGPDVLSRELPSAPDAVEALIGAAA